MSILKKHPILDNAQNLLCSLHARKDAMYAKRPRYPLYGSDEAYLAYIEYNAKYDMLLDMIHWCNEIIENAREF